MIGMTSQQITALQIDTLCGQFETALRNGDTTRIEDFLPQVEESQREALLAELLHVEVQFVSERCPSESADFLRRMEESLYHRFPEERSLIQSLFRRMAKLQQVGDYEILGELGRGGMGTVYKAKHKLLKQTVAIKVLSQAMLDDTQAVGRFKREMQLIGGLSHPNIVRALNAGETPDGIHYLAMEFVDGITLQKLTETIIAKADTRAVGDPPLLPIVPLGAACEMIRQAALGLQNAHELKLVHRDIKPANLMLDHQGTVKILDLGLGKFAEEHRQDYHSSLTMAGMVLGTVDYIAPEQCENSGEADIRSDLYSLGCSFYFLLTGKPVYSGSRFDTMRKKLMAHIVGEVPSLRQAIPGLHPAIEAILQQVLAKDSSERFQTPIEFAEALAPFASPEELWALTCEVIPADASGSRSGMRHSTPYGFTQSSRPNMAPPVQAKKTTVLLGLGVVAVICLIVSALVFFCTNFIPDDDHTKAVKREMAQHAETNARQLLEQWKITEAQEEYRTALLIRGAEFFDNPGDVMVRNHLVQTRYEAALLLWYHGDARGASTELQSILDTIGRQGEQVSSELALLRTHQLERLMELAVFRMLLLERRADITLFGGAASEQQNAERLTSAIARYRDAARAGTDRPRTHVIRWKQAILHALSGEIEEAKALLERNPLPTDAEFAELHEKAVLEYKLVRELAEAVLFYYQKTSNDVAEDSANRNEKLWAFQQQFALQSDPARGAIRQPEILELVLFCAEFLLHDSTKHEDWETLAKDVTQINLITANFLRQYPGAIPYMRRFYEVLVRSAALLHEKQDRAGDKRTQLNNIVGLLARMRPSEGTEDARTTRIFFFLPDTNKPEEGFVLFFPRDGKEGTLYPLPLTRQMVKQREGKKLPPLDTRLLEQIAAEKAAGLKIRVSWNDTAAWANVDSALTDAEYPYEDVLPLR